MDLKGLEKEYDTILDPSMHIIIRLDGHHFSKFKFEKPFEDKMGGAMVETSKDLLDRFGAYTAYTQSDEITLFIPSLWDDDSKKDWVHIFGGRVQKIVSIVSGYTTMCFNKHYSGDIDAYFDCRVYSCPNDSYVISSFSSRVKNCEGNSRSMFSQAYCLHKDLQGLSGIKCVKLAYDNTGKHWDSIDPMYKYGTFVKKEQYLQNVTCVKRKRICTFTGEIDYKGLVLLKYVPIYRLEI